jgi:hypothetical protein
MANIGITPAPWSQDNSRIVINLTVNARYVAGTNIWTYLQNGSASRTELGPDGYFRSFTAVSGTADATITWSAPTPASGDFVRKVGDTMTGALTIENGINSTSGTLYLGSQAGGLRSLNYDGTQYNLANANLTVGGQITASHFNGTATAIDNQANSATILATSTPTANDIARYDAAGQLWTNTTLGGYAGGRNSFGALSIWGVKGGWNGINFADGTHANSGTLMVDPAGVWQGFYNTAESAWLWRFANGVLDIGSVAQAANATTLAGMAITGFNRGDATGTGATNRTLTWNTDANDVTRPSSFTQFPPSTVNAPTTDWFFTLQTNHTANVAGNQYQWQLASPFSSDNMFYRRCGNAWGAWYKIPLVRQSDGYHVNVSQIYSDALLSGSWVMGNTHIIVNGSNNETNAAFPGNGALMFGGGPGITGEGIMSPRTGTDAGSLYLCTASASRMVIQSNGSLRIGSSSSAPSGISANSDVAIWRSSTGGTTGALFLNLAVNRYLFWDGTNYNMPGGNLVLNGVTVNSSAEIKKDIQAFSLKPKSHYHNLKPSWFRYKEYGTPKEHKDLEEVMVLDENNIPQKVKMPAPDYIFEQEQPLSLGFIAEDVEQVLPEAIQMSKEGANGEKPVKGFNPLHLTAVLWQRMQDAELYIERLEQRLANLEQAGGRFRL